MTEINSLLLEFTRREKLPPDYLSQRNARMASVMFRGSVGLEPKKASGFGAIAAPQLERVRMIASLEKTSDGKRKRRYDEALLPLLDHP